MTNEERKAAILELWHDIATDRSLQVGLRLKASEYEAKALGLISNEPAEPELNAPDNVTQQLQKLTIAQLEAIATADSAKITRATKKTTAPKAAGAAEAVIVSKKPVPRAKTPVKAAKTPNTANSAKGAAK